jgi:FHA domain
MNTFKFSTLAFIAVLVPLAAVLPVQPVAAQSAPLLTIDSCDDSAYPTVVCTVFPDDGTGLPASGLTAQAFSVTVDGSVPVADLAVESFTNDAVVVDTMLVVDFGMTRREQSLPQLREASERILVSLPATDQVGFVAVTGKVDLGDTNNPPLDDTREKDFAVVEQGRNNIINMIRQLSPVPATPLYDALCKAIILTTKRQIGTRAVVVISDGFDANASVACKEDDPIFRANRDRVPVFAIGVGSRTNVGYLKRLAIQTNGVFLEAADPAETVARFAEVQSRLKTRYRVSFTSPAPADNASRTVEITLNLAGARPSQRTQIRAVGPEQPTVAAAEPVTVDPTAEPPAPTAAPELPAGNPTLLRLTTPPLLFATLALGAVIVIGLVSLLVLLANQRKKKQEITRPFQQPFAAEERPTDVTSVRATDRVEDFDRTSVLGMPEESRTQVLGEGKTMVFKPPVARLRVTSGAQKDRVANIGGMSETLIIGREAPDLPEAGGLKLNSQFVSRRHAEIIVENERMLLRDLNSASGTKVDGVPVRDQQIELKPGSVIEFGDVSAVVEA